MKGPHLLLFQLGWLLAFILASLVSELHWWMFILPTIALGLTFAGAFIYGFIRSFKK